MAERKRRRKHTGLIVLAVVLAGIAALAIWQRNNIAAVIEFAAAGSQEEIEEKLQQNQQAIADAVEKNPEIVVRDVTEEEKQALRDGTLTQEELVDRLVGSQSEQTAPPKQEEKPTGQEQPKQEQTSAQSEQPPKQEEKPAEQPVESEYQKQLSAVIAKVYVLREKFTIALDNLQAEATAAYKAMPAEERNGSKLAKFISDFLARGTALEKECDADMDAIIAELDALIGSNNGDFSIIDTVVETYVNEKSLKKAWYMAELKKKGLA